jgi:hypothetical protein
VGDQATVPVRKGFWRYRGRSWQEGRSKELLANLARRYPDQRYFIITPVNEWNKNQVDLVAVRGLDRRSPAGVAQAVPHQQVLDPKWVLEGGPLLGMALSTSFDHKLPLLANALGSFESSRNLWLKALMSALTHDFLWEQQIVGQNERFPLFDARLVTENLRFLDSFLEYGLTRPQSLPSQVDTYFLEVFGTVKFFSEEMVSFWENFKVRSVDRALRKQTLSRVDDILEAWLGSAASRKEKNDFKARLNDIVRDYRTSLRSTKNWRKFKDDFVHALVMAPFSDFAIGQSLYDSQAEAIITAEEWKRLKTKYETRDSMVEDFAIAYQQERVRLLRP